MTDVFCGLDVNDEETLVVLGLVKALRRFSRSSTEMLAGAGGLPATLRFLGANIVVGRALVSE